MTLLVHDPIFLKHDTGAHVETAERLKAIDAELTRRGLIERCTRIPVKAIEEAAILRLHSPEQLDCLRLKAATGGGQLDPDTVVSRQSFKVALLSAGSCAEAVDQV